MDLEKSQPTQAKRRWNKPLIISSVILFAVALIAGLTAFFLLNNDKKDEIHNEKEIPARAGLAVGNSGGVAAEEERCSLIGTQVLKDGGNAVDAAIASALCNGVLNSFSNGIGGGGFMVIRLPNGDADVIDFRETAPLAATEDMFNSDPLKSQYGGLAVAVPGEIRGYEAAHKKYGRLPWARLFQPTIDLCENGFDLHPLLLLRLKATEVHIMSTPGFREIFTVTDPKTKQTELAPVGTRIYRKNLGKTLRTIATDGADAFYTGPIAESMIKTIRGGHNPGIMAMEDLKNYSVIFREPIVGSYRGHKIITSPAPTSGPVLLQMLNILEGYDLENGEAGANAVEMVEAMKWAFSSRTKLGDLNFIDMSESLAEMLDKAKAADIRALIKNDKTFPAAYYRPQYDPIDTPGTMHISAVDKDNMVVAMTSTVNLVFGAFLMDLETGILLNSQMNDFSLPNVSNFYLLPPAKLNFIKPGKRPISSTVPTIIAGEWLGAFGASGGSKIITTAAQSILNVIDYRMDAYESVAARRVHHQLFPEQLSVEKGYATTALNALQSAGHNVTMHDQFGSYAQVVIRLADGTINAASDPRKLAVAAAY